MRKLMMAAAFAAMALRVVPAAAVAPVPAVCGDVNSTGTVTAADALAVLKVAVHQPLELICAAIPQFPATGDDVDYGDFSDGHVQSGTARSFTDNGDGTVTDNVTGLMWEKKGSADDIHYMDNIYAWTSTDEQMDGPIVTAFLASLNADKGFAGHNDWRIPTITELLSLWNVGAGNPTAFTPFNDSCVNGCNSETCSCTAPTTYWSSSSSHFDGGKAWFVNFGDGGADFDGKIGTNHVRAVREAF